MLKPLFFTLGLLCAVSLPGQRTYKPSSVLATGSWYKIAIKAPGIYKVDVALLRASGMNADGISSAAIRLYGNGSQMLPENCSGRVMDDLTENAIEMADGGDSIFNGSDYFLFYAAGPDSWGKDSVNQRFIHHKNIYTDSAYYFITVGGTGKRISTATAAAVPVKTITAFSERYFYELDTINFLSSGKEWYGEEFADGPGKTVSRTFAVPLQNLIATEPAGIVSSCISHSVNAGSDFAVSSGSTQVLRQFIPAAGSGNQDVFARESMADGVFTMPSATPSVTYSYHPGGSGAQGWLNWFEFFARRSLSMSGSNQLPFRDWRSVGAGAGAFVVQGASAATKVWDVTDALTPVNMQVALSGNEVKFVNDCSTLHEYIAFQNTGFLTPVAIGKTDNQDLHHTLPADLLIITHPAVMEQARRLAAYHLEKDNLRSVIVTAGQVYNEFASGAPDPTAIRDFIKMYYDKAGMDTVARPKYVLLFGAASYDYKNRLPNSLNQVPAYQSNSSLDPLSTFTADDYFGFLDDSEDINANQNMNLLDIGIGRIPAGNATDAKAYVDKVMHYTQPATLGPWRNQMTFIADDEDFNLHLHDAENITAAAAATNPLFLQHKLYLDAFHEESNFSGSRYPEANLEINNQVQQGTLIWNYNGHGGFRRLAEEVVLDQDIVNTWNNPDRLPLFITATCDFAPYDNPATNSLGVSILLRQRTGAIALMTTTRLVFAYSNRIMNRNYLITALQPKPDGTYLSLGEAVKQAKNLTYQSSTDVVNNLKFTLLGDPALTLAYPKYNVQTTTVNNLPVAAKPDTLRALQPVSVSGVVTDFNGNALPHFNGTVYITVYDKPQVKTTLANDPESLKENFTVQENILFKGKADAKDGSFSFGFVVPKDVNYQSGFGRISYYAENGQEDASGTFSNFIIGGSGGADADRQGPDIKAFLNDEGFVNGGTTGLTPLLLLYLKDTSGINIVGTGIGHDITATLDSDLQKVYVLNSFFETDLNTYRQGAVRFTLPALGEGMHTLKIKVWDVANNSSETTISFRVEQNKHISIVNLINFPNPFTAKTTFRFQHDLEAQDIRVTISIFTLSGRRVKNLTSTINTGGSRSCDIDWDGKNDFGVDLPRGIYIYSLTVTTAGGVTAQKAQKLMIL